MNDTTEILDYAVNWISKSDSGFIGELFFVVKNSSGGSVSTPVGYLVGFVEPASEYSASYWKILMIIRDEVRYDVQQNRTRVFIKSVYVNKFKYYIDRLREINQNVIRINPDLPILMPEKLSQQGLCDSPLTMQVIIGKDNYLFSNVEFDFD